MNQSERTQNSAFATVQETNKEENSFEVDEQIDENQSAVGSFEELIPQV